MVDKGRESTASDIPLSDADESAGEAIAEAVTAVHLDDHRFEIPSQLATEIFDQLDASVDTTRAVMLTLTDDACIMIAPDDPMVIFVQRDVVDTGA
ncbi:hypothetical protein DFJ75_4222 [Williamsia muralis]|uniref:Halobacterial output domain-containing protein n=1 Tax=Williamsia marianensis TaxID=85044 RepID=A0A495K879_WILMA|nr:hypothetical protein [Williamsia muralis]RKR97351.1 hypothetical protein DFJ75_4222 [Williamsia muralis]